MSTLIEVATKPVRALGEVVARFLDMIESEGCTNAFAVPAQWQAVCASPSIILTELPRNASGKVVKPSLRSLIEHQDDRAPVARRS